MNFGDAAKSSTKQEETCNRMSGQAGAQHAAPLRRLRESAIQISHSFFVRDSPYRGDYRDCARASAVILAAGIAALRLCEHVRQRRFRSGSGKAGDGGARAGRWRHLRDA